MNDTSPAAEEIQVRIHRRMTGEERLVLALEMSESARELALARLRRAHPDWTDRELRRELLRYAFLAVDGVPAELPLPLR
jgi:hypothetical protein